MRETAVSAAPWQVRVSVVGRECPTSLRVANPDGARRWIRGRSMYA